MTGMEATDNISVDGPADDTAEKVEAGGTGCDVVSMVDVFMCRCLRLRNSEREREIERDEKGAQKKKNCRI